MQRQIASHPIWVCAFAFLSQRRLEHECCSETWSSPGDIARTGKGDTHGFGTRFLYDGAEMIAEYNASNALLRRYVFGPGVDEPLVWYEGAGTSDRRWSPMSAAASWR